MTRRRHWSYRGEHRRREVLERDLWKCQLRLEGCLIEATEVDHIIPKAWGGDDSLGNLRAACRNCNNALNNDKTRRAMERRFLGTSRKGIAPLRKVPPRGEWATQSVDFSGVGKEKGR